MYWLNDWRPFWSMHPRFHWVGLPNVNQRRAVLLWNLAHGNKMATTVACMCFAWLNCFVLLFQHPNMVYNHPVISWIKYNERSRQTTWPNNGSSCFKKRWLCEKNGRTWNGRKGRGRERRKRTLRGIWCDVQVGTVLQRDPRAKTYVVEKYHGYKICSIKNLMCVRTHFLTVDRFYPVEAWSTFTFWPGNTCTGCPRVVHVCTLLKHVLTNWMPGVCSTHEGMTHQKISNIKNDFLKLRFLFTFTIYNVSNFSTYCVGNSPFSPNSFCP